MLRIPSGIPRGWPTLIYNSHLYIGRLLCMGFVRLKANLHKPAS